VMSWRTRAVCAGCTLSALLTVFLLFRVLRKTEGAQPFEVAALTPVSHESKVSAIHQRKRRPAPQPGALISPDDRKDDEFAALRRDQLRSSAKVIQESFAVASSTPSLPSFTWLNPGPVNPYVEYGGQYTGVSGKLQAFAWEPSHPLVMYAGGGTGSGNEGPATEAGVFKTTDGGNTWTPVNQGLLDTAVDVLWIDQANPNTLLAGTEFGGLFRTVDGGGSWTRYRRMRR
jgi:hypothetical protein